MAEWSLKKYTSLGYLGSFNYFYTSFYNGFKIVTHLFQSF